MTDPCRRLPPRVLLVLATLAGLLGVLTPAASAAGHSAPAGARGAGGALGAPVGSGNIVPGAPGSGVTARSDVRHGLSRRSREPGGGVTAAPTAAPVAVPTATGSAAGVAELLAVLTTTPRPAPPLLLPASLARAPYAAGSRSAVPPSGRAPPAPAGT